MDEKFIYIKEYEYELLNPNNHQERYLAMPSWKEYLECFFNFENYKTHPDISMPRFFKILCSDLYNEVLMGIYDISIFDEFKHYAHIAEVVKREDIPYDKYIAEVRIEKVQRKIEGYDI